MALNFMQNPEILQQALAMQGKDTSFLEQPAPQPSQPQLPPETNQALEAVGSEYRVPAAEPAPAPAAPVETAPAPAPEPTREVQVPTDAVPHINTSGMHGTKRAHTEGINLGMDLKGAEGAIKAEGADKQASLAGELEDKRRAGLERADTRHDAALARKDQNTAKAYEALDSMTRKIKNPPDNTTGKVLGIIGSIISMGGGGKAVGSGLQMLGQALSTDLQEWAQGISGDDTIRKSLMEMNAAEDQGQESELNQEAKLSALAAGVYSAAIDKVVAETNSKEAKRAGEELKLGLRQQYLSHAMAVEGKAAAARQTTEIYRAIASQPTPEARAALAAQFGPAGTKALEAIQKGDKGAADLNATAVNTAKTAAEIQKLRSDTTGANGQKKLNEGEVKRDALVAGGANAFNRLQKVVSGEGVNRGATLGTWVPDALTSEETLQQRADVDNILGLILRNESGGAISENEIAVRRKGLGIDSGDPQVRAAGYKTLLDTFQAMDAQGRLGQGATQAQPSSLKGGYDKNISAAQEARQGISDQGRVEMVNLSTGEKRMVRPDLAKAYEDQGFIRNAVPEEDAPLQATPSPYLGIFRK